MYDVMISGYYGFSNSGDDALLLAIINDLRKYKKDIKIVALSRNPEETKRIYGVDAINRINSIQIIEAMKKTKLLISGGGSLIQDITSTKSLMYYLGIIWLAKKLGLKVMVYANGIGPIDKEANRKITRKILNQVDVITTREEGSKLELNRLGINVPFVKVTADPAITLEPAPDYEINAVFAKEKIDLSAPLAGFSIRKWKSEEKRYIEVIAQAADYMIEKYGVQPVFIPMQYPQDLPVARSIVSKMKGKGYIINNRYGVSQTLGIIKRMELLVGMRLHALIYAAALGVPVIGLAYEPKIEGFLRAAHQASAGPINQLTFDRLRKLVDSIWIKKTGIKKDLKIAVDTLKEKAVENARIAVELLQDKDKQVEISE